MKSDDHINVFEFSPVHPFDEVIEYEIYVVETQEKIGRMVEGPTLEYVFCNKYTSLVYSCEIIQKLYDEFRNVLEKRDE